MDQKSKVFGEKKDDDFSFLYEAEDCNEFPTDKNLESDADYFDDENSEVSDSANLEQEQPKDAIEAFFEQNSQNINKQPFEESKSTPAPIAADIQIQAPQNPTNNTTVTETQEDKAIAEEELFGEEDKNKVMDIIQNAEEKVESVKEKQKKKNKKKK